jgi:putative addiction module component (TIGR02574 family)
MSIKAIINEALALPVEERELLVDALLRSLDQPELDKDDEWVIVANKRFAEMKSGQVKPLSGEEVFERVRNRLGK